MSLDLKYLSCSSKSRMTLLTLNFFFPFPLWFFSSSFASHSEKIFFKSSSSSFFFFLKFFLVTFWVLACFVKLDSFLWNFLDKFLRGWLFGLMVCNFLFILIKFQPIRGYPGGIFRFNLLPSLHIKMSRLLREIFKKGHDLNNSSKEDIFKMPLPTPLGKFQILLFLIIFSNNYHFLAQLACKLQIQYQLIIKISA